MTTPRTVSGRAAISAMRPYVKRALGTTIVAIETEATAPYRDALEAADEVLGDLAGRDAASAWDEATRADFVARAMTAHEHVRRLLDLPEGEDAG